MSNQGILIYLYAYFSGTPLRAFTAEFFAEWLPLLLLVLAGLHILCQVLPKESRTELRSLFSVMNLRKVIVEGLFTFLPATIAWVITDVIKHLHPVARPFQELGLTPLVSVDDPMGSFPSGHATFFAALAMTIYLRDKKTGKWFLLGTLLIGLARIGAGIHWPIDILAGFFLGGIVAYLCQRIFLKFNK